MTKKDMDTIRNVKEFLDDMNDGAPDADPTAKEAGRMAMELERILYRLERDGHGR